MRKALIAVAVVAVALLLARRCFAPASPPVMDAPAEARKAPERETSMTERRGSGSDALRRVEPPRLSAAAGQSRVTFERGPRRSGENRYRYEDRVWFAERFDAFVRESGVSDAQRDAVLLALYDYVAAMQPLWGPAAEDLERGGKPTEEWTRRMFGTSSYDWLSSLHQILTPEQARVWEKYCGVCPTRLALYFYDEPVLRLNGER